jgi:hypothetical protein
MLIYQVYSAEEGEESVVLISSIPHGTLDDAADFLADYGELIVDEHEGPNGSVEFQVEGQDDYFYRVEGAADETDDIIIED